MSFRQQKIQVTEQRKTGWEIFTNQRENFAGMGIQPVTSGSQALQLYQLSYPAL